jgi:hypothetical protein
MTLPSLRSMAKNDSWLALAKLNHKAVLKTAKSNPGASISPQQYDNMASKHSRAQLSKCALRLSSSLSDELSGCEKRENRRKQKS